MKHAGPNTLRDLEPILTSIRLLPGLTERKPGIFYIKSKAFLHFHEDSAGVFADVKLSEEFKRFPVNTRSEQAAFVKLLMRHNQLLHQLSLNQAAPLPHKSHAD